MKVILTILVISLFILATDHIVRKLAFPANNKNDAQAIVYGIALSLLMTLFVFVFMILMDTIWL